MSPKQTQAPSKRAAPAKARTGGFTDDERAAMKERVAELKAEARRGTRSKQSAAEGEADVLAKIAAMPEADRSIATRIHAIVMASTPELTARTWYGMPAYAKGGNVVCFFQSAGKFKSRYATLGFSDKANLDDGNMWPTYYAIKQLTAAEERRIAALVSQALS